MRRRRTVELVGEQVVRRNQVKVAGFQRETAVERAEFAAPLRDVVAAEVRIFHKRAQRPVILVPGAADLPQLQVERPNGVGSFTARLMHSSGASSVVFLKKSMRFPNCSILIRRRISYNNID